MKKIINFVDGIVTIAIVLVQFTVSFALAEGTIALILYGIPYLIAGSIPAGDLADAIVFAIWLLGIVPMWILSWEVCKWYIFKPLWWLEKKLNRAAS